MFESAYGPVEAALVETYAVPEKALAAFRGRLGALQKQGLFGAENMPGKGSALVYRPDQLHRLIFACEMFAFEVGPSTILALVENLWKARLQGIFKRAETAAQLDPGSQDIILHIGGINLMIDKWSDAVPNINGCVADKLPGHVERWMRMGAGDPLPARAAIINLSSRLRIFHAAFAVTHLASLKRGS